MFNQVNKGLISRHHFNSYKKNLTWVCNKSKKLYFINKFQENKNNCKNTWKIINNMMNKKSKENVTKIIHNNLEFQSENMANEFNKYFTNIAPNLIHENYHNYYKNIKNSNSDQNIVNSSANATNSMFLYETNTDELSKIIKMVNSKSNNLYDININLIKLIEPKIITVLTYLINFCMKMGVYPTILKTGRVNPYF